MMSGTGRATSLWARTIRLTWGTAATTTPVSPIEATASTARNRSRRNTSGQATGRAQPRPGSRGAGPSIRPALGGSDPSRDGRPVGLDPPRQVRTALQADDQRVARRRPRVVHAVVPALRVDHELRTLREVDPHLAVVVVLAAAEDHVAVRVVGQLQPRPHDPARP